MPLERIWAGWRAAYVREADQQRGDGCFLCELADADPDDDRAGLVLARGPRTFAVMNLFPYGSGHLLVSPRRHVASLEDLDAEESVELMQGLQDAVVAIRAAYGPDGVNIGGNLGRAAGAGVPQHLHLHVLPRWSGDTNFMTTIAETRVLPEDLEAGWEKLRAAWPGVGA